MCKDQKLLNKVSEIYRFIELETSKPGFNNQKCRACGRCCDFDKFDHRLYITIPEYIYMKKMASRENIKFMQKDLCPYRINNKCSIHPYRFAGCRIFNCRGDEKLQGQLSEKVVKKFKKLCNEFDISYQYRDLAFVLSKESRWHEKY